MKFHLSQRQRKELTERGQTIHVALPNPPEQDAERWAAEVLATPADCLLGVEVVEILVRVARSGSGLTAWLGEISDMEIPGNLYTRQTVAAVRIVPPRVRGEILALQWPLFAEDDGRRIPPMEPMK